MAWAVDPALALSLQDHFPSNADVKHALEQLVVESAHEAKVRDWGRLSCVTSRACAYCCCGVPLHGLASTAAVHLCVCNTSHLASCQHHLLATYQAQGSQTMPGLHASMTHTTQFTHITITCVRGWPAGANAAQGCAAAGWCTRQ